ncbi:MAG: hypothetical protein QM295_02605, partial [Bacillota bacterium]|nr:hypothetical protein [Bacillota bacterium]
TKGANSDSRNSDINSTGGQRPPLCSKNHMWQTKRPHATHLFFTWLRLLFIFVKIIWHIMFINI